MGDKDTSEDMVTEYPEEEDLEEELEEWGDK